MRSGEPWFCGSVLFIKTKHENVLFCVKGLSRDAPEVRVPTTGIKYLVTS